MTEDHDQHSVEGPSAAGTAATAPQDEVGGAVDRNTVERSFRAAYQRFATDAAMPNVVPSLAERCTGERLDTLAQMATAKAGGTPTVLFLCVHNAGRSQMALGFFRHLAGDRATAWSGGTQPGNEINAAAVEAMREHGIDISGEFPKPWAEEIVRAVDVVITMGCGDSCPVFPGKRYLDWALDDPAGQGLEAVRPIRDEIERRVRSLLDELGVPIRS